MALVTVQRSPSNSNSSSTISDNEFDNEERVKKQCESFFAVKGAALVLPRSNESRPIKKNPIVGELSDHIQSMFLLLRHDDRMTLAVRLESMYEERIRYIILVTSNGIQDTEESIIIGVDIMSNTATIGLVLPIWCETTTQLDGDGGFNICTKNQTHTFKPVSVQALWSAMQAIHSGITTARSNNYFPGGLNLTWIGYYESRINSSSSRIKEWELMPELEVTKPHAFTPTYSEDGHYYPSDRELTEQLIFVKIKDIMASADLDLITSREVRLKLEAALGKSLRDYRHYLDEQLITYMRQMDSASLIFDHIYLGSEWNASHLEELEKNGVGYILNVTMEIDNFYPNRFIYHNVRLYDIESSELLKYWDETYKFLTKAKEKGSKALVHCKMGISRSAATVIAYAMKEYNWPLETARDFVSKKRKCVNPNDGFLQQLQVYEGMLDASRQRHNKLWRSKSESSLASSAECSQETIESTSSIEDITDCVPKISGTTPQTIAPKTTIPSPGLAPHTGHARRRSWSPKDSVAEAHFPSNVHNVPSKEKKESYLRGTDVDFMMLDTDDCQDIQIIVPELLSPSSPTLSIPTESIVLCHTDDSEPSTLMIDIEGTSIRPYEGKADSLVLKQVTSHATLAVGESPSGFKDGIPEMTSTPKEPEGEHMEISSPSDDLEMSPETELNTNNNSASGIGSCEHIDDVPPMEGTVKLRVTSFENHQLCPENDEISEVKSQEECTSTVEGGFSEPEIPVSSGTVQKQKQDIEDRIKAKAAEKESPPLTRSGKFFSDTALPTNDSTTSETDDTASTDQPNVAESHDLIKSDIDDCTTPSPLSPTLCLLQETTSTASPTLQALEKGRVKKITEQLLSQKSPTKDLDVSEQQLIAEKKSQTDESESSPPNSPIKFALPDNKSSHIVSTFSLKIESTEVIPPRCSSQSLEDNTSQPLLASEESIIGSPSKEAFIKTYFGEEIPLEPGTVKRQTIDFEQLSSNTQHEESEPKKEADTKKDTPEIATVTPESSYAEDMVVIIRDSTTNGKRKFEEDRSQNKYARVDQIEEADKERAECEEDAINMNDGSQDNSGINSAYPEEGISSWKVGDVRKHTKQFEGLTTTEMIDQSVKPVEDTSCTKPSFDESIPFRDNTEQVPTTPTGPGLSDGVDSCRTSSHIDEDVDHGSEAMEKKKLKEVEGIRERIEKLGLVSLRRTASIARISNERGSPVVLRRSDFSRPVAIRGFRSRSDSGTRSLESSPEKPSQFGKGDLTVDDRRKSAHAKLVTPRPDIMPLQFYLEKPTSVEIRNLGDANVMVKDQSNIGTGLDMKSEECSDSTKVTVDKGNETQKYDCPLSSKKKQQHGKSHPLSKLSPTPTKHSSYTSS